MPSTEPLHGGTARTVRRCSILGPMGRPTDHYAMALIGVDRPGIVASVTGALAGLGCNLEDVSTSLLRGHFAMVVEFSAPAGADFGAIRSELLGRSAALDLHLEV